MDSKLDKIRTRARLLLAADRWRELMQFLEGDVPSLIAEVEQLQGELAEARSDQGRLRHPTPETPRPPARSQGESHLVTCRQFAQTMSMSERTVSNWIRERKINIVRLGRSVRIPRTEIRRLMAEGVAPVRPSQGHIQ
jgi:excisionase family DNA binding protein